MKRSADTRKVYQKALYKVSQFISRVIFVILGRIEIYGAENVPEKGPVLIASNHLSNADPNIVGSSIGRPIFYFAKEELFQIPFLGWFISQVNAFPVRRAEHDVGAFKKARALLEEGQGVLLFPEGHRSRTGELGKAKAGIGMLACKSGSPVVPVCIIDSDKLLQFHKVKIAFGPPLRPKSGADKDDYQAFSDQIMAAIADLKSKLYNDFSS